MTALDDLSRSIAEHRLNAWYYQAFQRDNPVLAPLVLGYLDGGPRPTDAQVGKNHYALGLVLAEDARRALVPPPPPPPTGKLTWAPPALSNPITVDIPKTGPVPVYGQQPWVVEFPTNRDVILNLGHRRETASGYAGLSIRGGRNIVMIGGELEIAIPPQVRGDGQCDALVFTGHTGIVHVEGVYIHGNPLRAFCPNTPGGVYQFQNCRAEIRMGWNGSYDQTDHSDIEIDYSAPSMVRYDRCTFEYDNTGFAFYSDGGTRILKRTNLRNRPDKPTGHDFIHRNVKATLMEFDDFWTETGFGFDSQGKPTSQQFTLKNAWLFAQPAMTLHGDGKSPGSYVTFDSPTTDNVGGTRIDYGVPPGGDFCPIGVPGVNYVSPGYV